MSKDLISDIDEARIKIQCKADYFKYISSCMDDFAQKVKEFNKTLDQKTEHENQLGVTEIPF